MGRLPNGALVASVTLWTSSIACAGQLTWQRQTDWSPGLNQGSSANNPGPAAGGPGVWMYEWTQGGPLGSVNPWYVQPRNLAKWDQLWWNTGQGAWTAGDNVSPPMLRDRITHNLHSTTFADIPVVSWINPMGDGAQVTVGGSVVLRWSGKNGLGYPVDVDVFVGLQNALSGLVTPLFSGTFAKPTGSASINEETVIPLNISTVLTVNTNDRIILTHRGRDPFGPLGMWVTLFDSGMTITLVPTPGTAALLGLAGAALAVRRRRA